MKCIFCARCGDLVALRRKVMRYCRCNESWGQYLDDDVVEVFGGSVVVVIGNRSLMEGVLKVALEGLNPGPEVKCGVIGNGAKNVINRGDGLKRIKLKYQKDSKEMYEILKKMKGDDDV